MSGYVTKKTDGNTAWLTHDRFGMFIHFGLYSMAARHEWVMKREHYTVEKYSKYFENFNPTKVDFRKWAKSAKAAGMKYAILTSKHHEVFCLFDTKYTDYNVMNTPYGKDIVKQFLEAFREEGLKVGLYYSLLDWHHPDFTVDYYHPRCEDADAAEQNKTKDTKVYAQYMRDQVTELLTNYGKLDIIWFDYTYPAQKPKYPHLFGKSKEDWESEKLIKLIRSLQPEIIINDRTGIEQDVTTPEQYQVEEWTRSKETGELVVWEACHTFSGSWGYHRDEQTWKSPQMLIELLVKSVSLGGNLLMNVGPCAKGTFDSRAEDALKVFEKWMDDNGESIYGCTMAEPEFTAPEGTRLTQTEDGKRLYIHLLDYPFGIMSMKNLGDKIKYAQFLHDYSEVRYRIGETGHFGAGCATGENTVFFRLPPVKPNQIVPVIEVILK